MKADALPPIDIILPDEITQPPVDVVDPQGDLPVSQDDGPTPSDAIKPTDDGPGPTDDGGEVTPNGNLLVSVDDVVVSNGGAIPLPAITPALGVEKRLAVSLNNAGTSPVELSQIQLLVQNEDETPKNAWVTLDFGFFNPGTGLPMALEPSGGFGFDVVYTPQSFDINNATLRVVSDDPTAGAFTVNFIAPAVVPQIRLEPSSAVFENASLTEAEVQTFAIHNDGIAPLVIDGVSLIGPGSLFEILSAPAVGAQVKPVGSTGYAPAEFTVRYKPTWGSKGDSASVEVFSNDPVAQPAVLSLKSTFETGESDSPCVLSWESQDLGYLDFTSAVIVAETQTVTMTNLGAGVCTISGINFPEDFAGSKYTWALSVVSPDPETPPTPVTNLPLGVGTGFAFQLDVTYSPGSSSVDATLEIDYQDPQPKTASIPVKGGGPEPCFEFAPGSATNPLVLQMAGNDGESVQRKFAVYNCGDAPLTINEATPAGADGVDVFALVGSPPLPWVIEPHGVFLASVGTSIETDPIELAGTLTFAYTLKDGPTTTAIPLQRRFSPQISLPVADPGSPADYPGLVAGQPFTLDGSDSVPGSEFLSNNGYTWLLTSKPAGSQLEVHVPPGKAHLSVTPDLPGSYGFGLIVKTLGSKPHYSPLSTVTVNVAPN